MGLSSLKKEGSLPLPADNWRLGLWLSHHFTNAQKMVPPRPSKQKFATRNSSWQRWVSGHVPSALLTSAHPSQRPPLRAKTDLPVGGKAASLSGESQNGHSNEIWKQFSKVTGGLSWSLLRCPNATKAYLASSPRWPPSRPLLSSHGFIFLQMVFQHLTRYTYAHACKTDLRLFTVTAITPSPNKTEAP